MSIGMCFNDDIAWGVSKENRRLGMSVKEIYEALDQLDRLKESYKELREEHLKLQRIVGEADMDMKRTAEIYLRVANSAESFEDELEFLAKASGLREAQTILRKKHKRG